MSHLPKHPGTTIITQAPHSKKHIHHICNTQAPPAQQECTTLKAHTLHLHNVQTSHIGPQQYSITYGKHNTQLHQAPQIDRTGSTTQFQGTNYTPPKHHLNNLHHLHVQNIRNNYANTRALLVEHCTNPYITQTDATYGQGQHPHNTYLTLISYNHLPNKNTHSECITYRFLSAIIFNPL
jgi:hypothetical protein